MSAFRLPAETAPQASLWMGWPCAADKWPGRAAEMARTFATLAATAARYQTVAIACARKHHAAVEKTLRAASADLDRVQLHDVPTGDVWLRDFAPLFGHDGAGQPAARTFRFNGWGGKFPHTEDAAATARMAEAAEVPATPIPLVLEGGAVETDGAGTLLTTESVLLTPTRLPGPEEAADLARQLGCEVPHTALDPASARRAWESVLGKTLGLTRVLWLPRGLANDDTDGHIDTLTRFVTPDLLVTCTAPAGHPDHHTLAANREHLQELGADIAELPLPAVAVRASGPRQASDTFAHEGPLPASYANYVVVNGAVLVPQYGVPKSDDHALGLLRELFGPSREVLGLDCRTIVEEGGALHCLTANRFA